MMMPCQKGKRVAYYGVWVDSSSASLNRAIRLGMQKLDKHSQWSLLIIRIFAARICGKTAAEARKQLNLV